MTEHYWMAKTIWHKDEVKIATKFIFLHLIYCSFQSKEHVKRMLFIYVLTLLMYAGKLIRYGINYFVIFLYNCMYWYSVMHMSNVKNVECIKEIIMRCISPSMFLQWMLCNINNSKYKFHQYWQDTGRVEKNWTTVTQLWTSSWPLSIGKLHVNIHVSWIECLHLTYILNSPMAFKCLM